MALELSGESLEGEGFHRMRHPGWVFPGGQRQAGRVIEAFEHQTLAQNGVSLAVGSLNERWIRAEVRLFGPDRRVNASRIFKQEEIAEEGPERSEAPLAEGRPDVDGIPDRLFDPVVVVVAE